MARARANAGLNLSYRWPVSKLQLTTTRASCHEHYSITLRALGHCPCGEHSLCGGERSVVLRPNEISRRRRVVDCAIVATRLNIIVIAARTKAGKRRLNCRGNCLLTRRPANTMALLTRGFAPFIAFIRAWCNAAVKSTRALCDVIALY